MVDSAERVEQIRARAETATPGPWYLTDGYEIGPDPENNSYSEVAELNLRDSDNGVFIAHARSDIDWLLARVAELEALVEAHQRVEARLVRESNEWQRQAEGRQVQPRRQREARRG